MVLKNKLNITSPLELSQKEEKASKKMAIFIFDQGILDTLDTGSYAALKVIHKYMFFDIYEFAGKTRTENIIKSNFRFIPVIYLKQALKEIDLMPHKKFDEIVEKYIEMNVAHPFQKGSGRSTRIWLNLMLKNKLKKVVDWTKIDKEDYLYAMALSPLSSTELKQLLEQALTDDIDNRELYVAGIEQSFYYDGYTMVKTDKM